MRSCCLRIVYFVCRVIRSFICESFYFDRFGYVSYTSNVFIYSFVLDYSFFIRTLRSFRSLLCSYYFFRTNRYANRLGLKGQPISFALIFRARELFFLKEEKFNKRRTGLVKLSVVVFGL